MPSLSQSPVQSSGVTVSPYHWWTSSWTIVWRTSRDRYSRRPNVTSDWVSIAESPGTTTAPAVSNG